MFKEIVSVFIFSLLLGTSVMANAYECRFVQKNSYSNWKDTTPNKTQNINMKVIYRITGNELLTLPSGTSTTYVAHFTRKSLDRNGRLYYWFRSNIGYVYALSEDMSQALEITPSGKTVLHANCRPM